MATQNQKIAAREGAGSQVKARVSQQVTLTVAGNTTVKDSTISLPAGSVLRGVGIETETAITGTPTTCNVRVGTADTGQQIVADVDAKAQGHIAATLVAALAKVGGFASLTQIFIQVVTAGGTSSAGTIYVLIDYDAPVL